MAWRRYKKIAFILVALLSLGFVVIYTSSSSSLGTHVFGDTKVILFWSTYFGTLDFYLGMGREPFKNCPYSCETTNDRRRFNESSAVLIHPRDILPNQLDLLPKYRLAWQRFVMYLLEPPTMAPPMGAYNGLFNWTMTYRRDSDIYNPYGQFVPSLRDRRSRRIAKKRDGEKEPLFQDKNRLVVWTVSHCQTQSKRENYVRELVKYIPVDIYGKCSGVKCRVSEDDCTKMLPEYKFYIAFESSLCKDYVTEKLWRNGFGHNAVPIVLGGEEYSRVLPPNSYIDVADFRSPHHLAEYLKTLIKDRAAFEEYFRWKDEFEVQHRTKEFREGVFCKLCEKLHNVKEPRKSYDRLDLWWSEEQDCLAPEKQYTKLAKYFEN